nr:unnamed protein product [Callosobruchus chinensis]
MEKYPLFEDCPLKLTSRQYFMAKIQEQTGHTLAVLDAAQLICNVHHAISTHRKYNILPFLKHSARKIIETSKSDKYFFGKNFVADLKATDAAKKTFEGRQTYPKNLNWKHQPPSTTDPTCELTCLGFTYNTLDMTLFLPEKKNVIQRILIGKLVAAGPTLKYGWIHIKNFEREKYLALKKFNNNYNMPPLQVGAVIAMTGQYRASGPMIKENII